MTETPFVTLLTQEASSLLRVHVIYINIAVFLLSQGCNFFDGKNYAWLVNYSLRA